MEELILEYDLIASKKLKNIKSFTCGFDLSSASGIEMNFDEKKKQKNYRIYVKLIILKWF